MKNTKNN